jgi:putative nucleotidyltransferase with HDIG domain
MDEKSKDTIASAIESFPAMSSTALKVLELLQPSNWNANADEIEKVIRYDQGLTANILKLVNSAYYGLNGTVGSIRQAVTRLGWKRMRYLVMASAVNALMDDPVPGYDLERGALWRHSVAAAVVAETLVERAKINDADEAFTAALLHDIGKLVLGKYVQADQKAIDDPKYSAKTFVEVEREVLGTDHAEVGAWVLQTWDLPGPLVDAVRWHHEPDKCPNPTVTLDITHASDMICLMMGLGLGRDGLRYEASSAVSERLDLDADDIESIGLTMLAADEELCMAIKSANS